eukprot:CAMPEP_0174735306 /NCGR_PEP_ID=MMETSP1094-20130205/64751_1 /TAXON_ID=156173 /ORGANISM="Chrysochromulina brevifilum, Strain UTEX LB 985" /LENGTH=140 /DNA_ID=CAMNT_0015938255 /DNA_START=151 /DNA_END=573 /DNA_ORIENTATION=+
MSAAPRIARAEVPNKLLLVTVSWSAPRLDEDSEKSRQKAQALHLHHLHASVGILELHVVSRRKHDAWLVSPPMSELQSCVWFWTCFLYAAIRACRESSIKLGGALGANFSVQKAQLRHLHQSQTWGLLGLHVELLLHEAW